MFDEKTNRDLISLIRDRGWELYDVRVESMDTLLLGAVDAVLKPVDVGEKGTRYLLLPRRDGKSLKEAISSSIIDVRFPAFCVDESYFGITHIFFSDTVLANLNLVAGKYAYVPYHDAFDAYRATFRTLHMPNLAPNASKFDISGIEIEDPLIHYAN